MRARKPRSRAVRLAGLLVLPILILFMAAIDAGAQDNTAQTGTLPGAFAVSNSGSASFQIDLQTPPGTRGTGPDLSVTYDSREPNGLLGVGFTLRGLSVIGRCKAQTKIDSFAGAIRYNKDDRFCLDGQRLIKIEGAGDYGADGSVYHTEKETWTKVQAVGTCGSGPCSFKAWTKQGMTVEYTAYLTVPNAAEKISWQMTKLTDLNGNVVTVSYTVDTANNQVLPDKIDYTSNPSANVAALFQVRFQYTDRPDILTTYAGGLKFSASRRLDKITTWLGGSGILEYRFKYTRSGATKRSLISEIQGCSASGRCMPATKVAWTQGVNEVVSVNQDPNGVMAANTCAGTSMDFDWTDFNGDGLPDLGCQDIRPDVGVDQKDSVRPYLALSNGSTLQPALPKASGDWCLSNNGTKSLANGNHGWVDFNGDQKSDLVCSTQSGIQKVLLSDGTSAKSPASTNDGTVRTGWCMTSNVAANNCTAGYGNVSNDGRSDFLCGCGVGTGSAKFQALLSQGNAVASPNGDASGTVKTGWCTASKSKSFWEDFNGDGKDDIVCIDGGGSSLSVMVSTGTGVQSPNTSSNGVVWSTAWCSAATDRLTAVDVNGDGNTDLHCRSENGAQRILLSTGTLLTSASTANPDGLVLNNWCAGSGAQIDWGDFNGDGMPDLLCTVNGTQSVKLTTITATGVTLVDPGGSGSVVKSDWCTAAAAKVKFADINGDALQDLACDQTDGVHKAMVHKPQFPDLVASIANGIGGVTTIAYAPLTSAGVYGRAGQTSAYPMLSAQTPWYVVSSYSYADGSGWSATFNQFYAGLQMEIDQGLLLGFLSISTTEQATGRKTTKTFSQTYPQQGFELKTTVFDSGGAPLSEVIRAPGVSTPYPKVSLVLLASRTVNTYSGGTVAVSSTADYRYDSYGNVTLTLDRGAGDPSMPPVFTCTRYSNDTAQWRLGYPLQGKTTRTEAACTGFLSSASPSWNEQTDLHWQTWTYDSKKNKTSSAVWDNKNSLWLSTGITHNAVGLPDSLTDTAGKTSRIGYQYANGERTTTTTSPPTANAGALTASSVADVRFGMMIRETDVNGNQMRTVLDSFGRPVELWGPDPVTGGAATLQLQKATYLSKGKEIRTRHTWAEGGVGAWPWRVTTVDGLGRMVSLTKGGAGTKTVIETKQTYDRTGRPWKAALPAYEEEASSWVETLYDERNRPVTRNWPDGTVNVWSYAEGGQAALTVTANPSRGSNRAVVSAFNARGSLITSTLPNNGITTNSYDSLQQLIKTVSPNGTRTDLEYDSLGRPTRQTNGDTGTTSWFYNQAGRLYQTTNGTGNLVTFLYDDLSRVVSRTSTRNGTTTLTSTYAYDQAGATNGKGRLTTLTRPDSTETFGYGPYGQVTSETLALAGSRYAFQNSYDPQGRIADATFPDGAVGRTTYQLLGPPATVQLKDVGETSFSNIATYFSYNAAGRPRVEELRSGVRSTYDYYTYQERLGALKNWTLRQGADTSVAPLYTADYTWNPFLQIDSVQRKRAGQTSQTTRYTYEATGWLDSAAAASTTSFDYDPAGNITVKDGVTFTQTANTDRVASASNGSSFIHNGGGAMTGAARSPVAWCYDYDVESNLRSVTKNSNWTSGTASCSNTAGFSQVVGASYDNNGRRLTRTDPDGTVNLYISGDFEERRTGGRVFQTKYLDGPFGRIVSITREVTPVPAAVPAAQPSSQPSSATEPLPARTEEPAAGEQHSRRDPLGGGTNTLLALFGGLVGANPFGRGGRTAFARSHRWLARIAPAVVLSLVLSSIPVVQPHAEMGPGGGYPVPGTLYFHHNQIDSVVMATKPDGTEAAYLWYRPFGEIDQEQSGGPNTFRQKFTAKETDENSNLIYFGARYYSPQLGRFLEPDPAGQFNSPYVYANNDPQTLVDPDGQFVFLLVMAIGAIAGAYFGGQAANHSYNPIAWNWRKGKTYAAVFAGAALGAAGGALGAEAAEAGVAAGMIGNIAGGAAENVAFGAIGGDHGQQLGIDALTGAATGLLAEGAGAALGAAGSRLARRGVADFEGVADNVASAASCHSFVTGTLVNTASGLRPIEEVRAGEQVWAYGADPAATSRQAALYPVQQTFVHDTTRLVTVSVGGVTIEVTPQHPFWVDGRGWVEAQALRPGMSLLAHDGSRPDVTAATEKEVAPTKVWNFTVDTAHTYQVSGASLLVHNPDCYLSQMTVPPSKMAQWEEWELQKLATAEKYGDPMVFYSHNYPHNGRMYSLFNPDGATLTYGDYTAEFDLGPYFGRGSRRDQHFAAADQAVRTFGNPAFDRSVEQTFSVDNGGGPINVVATGTWHHTYNRPAVQFVPREVHTLVPHVGGMALYFN